MIGHTQKTFRLPAPHRVYGSVSNTLHDPYLQIVTTLSFHIFAYADCGGLTGRLAQELGNKSHCLFCL